MDRNRLKTRLCSLKKTIDNKFSLAELRRKEEIETIQNLLEEGFAPVQIKDMLQTTYNRIRRYTAGDPEKLCRFGGGGPSQLDNYQADIIQLLEQNMLFSQALPVISELGYTGKRKAFEAYCHKLIAKLDIPYCPRRSAAGTQINPKARSDKHYLPRSAVFKHFWSG